MPSMVSRHFIQNCSRPSILKDFHELWPERFSNKTNGVTPRRFLALSNPDLRELLDRTLGQQWLTEPVLLRKLDVHSSDDAFQRDWRAVKLSNKQRLASYIQTQTGDRDRSRLAVRHSGEAHS